MLYFAYGSNLDYAQMRQRCSSALFAYVARLDNHRLAFSRKSQRRNCGVADVVQADGAVVWGVVYEIDDAQVPALDRTEGFQRGRDKNAYDRREKNVVAVEGARERQLTVQTYVVAKPETNPSLPSAEYIGTIIEGARFWKLPVDYVEQLARIKTEHPR